RRRERSDRLRYALRAQARRSLQIFGEIGLREGDDAVVVSLRAAHHALAPPVFDDRLRCFHAWAVETIEWSRRQVAVKLRAVRRYLCLESVEHLLIDPPRLSTSEALARLGRLGLSLDGLAFSLSPRQEDVDGTKVTADRVSAQLGVLVAVLQQFAGQSIEHPGIDLRKVTEFVPLAEGQEDGDEWIAVLPGMPKPHFVFK